MRKSVFVKVVFMLAIAVSIFFILLLRDEFKPVVTGQVVKTEEKVAPEVVTDKTVEFRTEELTKCCSFTNSLGQEDACYTVNNRDCIFCSDYCS